MVEGGQMTSIMDQLIPHSPCGRPEVSGDVQPIRIFGVRPRRADVDVNVAGLRMIYDTTDERMITLLRGNDGLRVNT
jgi:hypothetical protein